MELQYPVGFRFHLKDEELVGYYLQNRAAMGNRFQSNPVFDCLDFHGQEPWTIWDNNGGTSDTEALYFFADRKKLSANANRFDRKAGSGTWSGENKTPVYDRSGRIIGSSRHFRYEGGGCESLQDRWLMDEFEMTKNDITVLCCLRKSPRMLAIQMTTTTTAVIANDIKKKRKRTALKSVKGGDEDHRNPKAARKPKKKEKNQEQCGTITLPDQDHYQSSMAEDASSNNDVQFHGHNQLSVQDCYPELLAFDESAPFNMDELFTAPTPQVLSYEFDLQENSLVSHDQSYDSNNFGLESNEFGEQLYDGHNFSLVADGFQGLLYEGDKFQLEESLWAGD